MRIATYQWGGRRHVGVVSSDAREITPIDLKRRQEQVQSRGAQALLEHLAEGGDFPAANGTRLPISAGHSKPRCRARGATVVCGPQLSRACEGIADHGFKGSEAKIDQWPIVFTKVPECVVAHRAPIRLPGAPLPANRLRAELAVVIGRRDQHFRRPSDGLRVGLHDRQRRYCTRRADAACAMGYWQVLRHFLPDGSVAGRRNRA